MFTVHDPTSVENKLNVNFKIRKAKFTCTLEHAIHIRNLHPIRIEDKTPTNIIYAPPPSSDKNIQNLQNEATDLINNRNFKLHVFPLIGSYAAYFGRGNDVSGRQIRTIF